MYSLSNTTETDIIEIDVCVFSCVFSLFLLLLFPFFPISFLIERETGLHKAHLGDNQLISIHIINDSSLIVIHRLLHIFLIMPMLFFRRFGPYYQRK